MKKPAVKKPVKKEAKKPTERPEAPKKKQKQYVPRGYKDENAPLTTLEKAFVSEYLKDPTVAYTAYIKANPRCKNDNTARARSCQLLKKPNVEKYIAEKMGRFFERLDFDAFDILKRIGHIAFADLDEVCEWDNGRVTMKASDELTPRAKALIASVEESINERGDRSVRVKTKDSMVALNMLCKYYGLLNPSRQAKAEPLTEQVEVLKKVKDGELTPIEGALELEIKGIALPDTLRVMIGRYQPDESDKEGEMIIPTAEEMEARRQARLREIEQQKESFLPERQAEVRQIKEELGEKNKAFAKEAE